MKLSVFVLLALVAVASSAPRDLIGSLKKALQDLEDLNKNEDVRALGKGAGQGQGQGKDKGEPVGKPDEKPTKPESEEDDESDELSGEEVTPDLSYDSPYKKAAPVTRAEVSAVLTALGDFIKTGSEFFKDQAEFFSSKIETDAELLDSLRQLMTDIIKKGEDSFPALMDSTLVLARLYIFGLDGFDADKGCGTDVMAADFITCVTEKHGELEKVMMDTWQELLTAEGDEEKDDARCETVKNYMCSLNGQAPSIEGLRKAVGDDINCFSGHLQAMAEYLEHIKDNVSDEELKKELAMAHVYLSLVHMSGAHITFTFSFLTMMIEYPEAISMLQCGGDGNDVETRKLASNNEVQKAISGHIKRTMDGFISQLKVESKDVSSEAEDINLNEVARQLVDLLKSDEKKSLDSKVEKPKKKELPVAQEPEVLKKLRELLFGV